MEATTFGCNAKTRRKKPSLTEKRKILLGPHTLQTAKKWAAYQQRRQTQMIV